MGVGIDADTWNRSADATWQQTLDASTSEVQQQAQITRRALSMGATASANLSIASRGQQQSHRICGFPSLLLLFSSPSLHKHNYTHLCWVQARSRCSGKAARQLVEYIPPVNWLPAEVIGNTDAAYPPRQSPGPAARSRKWQQFWGCWQGVRDAVDGEGRMHEYGCRTRTSAFEEKSVTRARTTSFSSTTFYEPGALPTLCPTAAAAMALTVFSLSQHGCAITV
jgi:hypothetical protein